MLYQLNYTRLNKLLFTFIKFKLTKSEKRALPDSNWDTPNWQLSTLPIKLRALILYSYINYSTIAGGGRLYNFLPFFIYLPNLVIYILTTCWNVNKGKIYLENTNIKANKVKNEKVNWLTK